MAEASAWVRIHDSAPFSPQTTFSNEDRSPVTASAVCPFAMPLKNCALVASISEISSSISARPSAGTVISNVLVAQTQGRWRSNTFTVRVVVAASPFRGLKTFTR